MERAASLIVIIGVLFWIVSVLVFKGLWRVQMISAAIIIFGIVLAHISEEFYQEEDE
ncbi:MAG: hypothetical protein QGI86_13280 [Candidatus Poribacteria bacterium]|jgi:positive regulator of sigma E activity|nr:hypothetical protein [Candidatus Poribacteria bacterium]MDP6747399.1 hypothetical protein [Candidatus Poribacteria bacterium]MDP6962016.1 hypothetical protein [Dehalococcoidia bacterium]